MKRVSMSATEPQRPIGTFRREGEYWTIAYAGVVVRLRDTKGLQYLGHLVASTCPTSVRVVDTTRPVVTCAVTSAVLCSALIPKSDTYRMQPSRCAWQSLTAPGTWRGRTCPLDTGLALAREGSRLPVGKQCHDLVTF
jgi:hypothetical protein